MIEITRYTEIDCVQKRRRRGLYQRVCAVVRRARFARARDQNVTSVVKRCIVRVKSMNNPKIFVHPRRRRRFLHGINAIVFHALRTAARDRTTPGAQ